MFLFKEDYLNEALSLSRKQTTDTSGSYTRYTRKLDRFEWTKGLSSHYRELRTRVSNMSDFRTRFIGENNEIFGEWNFYSESFVLK